MPLRLWLPLILQRSLLTLWVFSPISFYWTTRKSPWNPYRIVSEKPLKSNFHARQFALDYFLSIGVGLLSLIMQETPCLVEKKGESAGRILLGQQFSGIGGTFWLWNLGKLTIMGALLRCNGWNAPFWAFLLLLQVHQRWRRVSHFYFFCLSFYRFSLYFSRYFALSFCVNFLRFIQFFLWFLFALFDLHAVSPLTAITDKGTDPDW